MLTLPEDIELGKNNQLDVIEVVNRLAVLRLLNEYEVEIRSEQPLSKGELIIFDELITGLVIEVGEENVTKVKTYTKLEEKPSKARVKLWWEVNHNRTKIIVPETFWFKDKGAGFLYGKCIVKGEHYAGTIGWDLVYSPFNTNSTFIVAIGNDIDTPCLCYLETPGYFPTGVYTLTAQKFYKHGYFKLGRDTCTWTVKEPTKSLICNSTNGKRPLALMD